MLIPLQSKGLLLCEIFSTVAFCPLEYNYTNPLNY